MLNTYSPRVLIVDMSCVTSLDVTGLDAIATVHSDCVFKGTAFFLAGLRRDMTSQFLAAFPDTVSSAPAATARLTKPLILRQFTAIDENKGGRGMSPQPTRRASSARRGVDVHDDSNDPDVEMQPLNSFDDRDRHTSQHHSKSRISFVEELQDVNSNAIRLFPHVDAAVREAIEVVVSIVSTAACCCVPCCCPVTLAPAITRRRKKCLKTSW